jgi:oligosaccharide repeat unit polymerase
MLKKLIANPNFIYIFSFIVPFVFYSFGWSTLYPELSLNLFLFYIFTFLICLVIGLFVNHNKPFQYVTVKESNGNIVVLIVLYMLYVIEIAYSRKVPLLGLLTGSFDYSEDTFGIPIIHTFLVSFNMFYGVYLFHQYMSNQKKSILMLFFLSIVPFIFLVYRSSILSIIIGSLIVFILGKKSISFKIFSRTIAISVFVFYMFGFLGNLRSGQGDSTFIPRASGATNEFLDSNIPKEFYWSYLYIASPVANLQNNINYVHAPEGNYTDLILNEFLPNFFVKFLTKQETREFNQINPFLNVGTIYVFGFSYLRWQGIIVMFFYFILVVNLYYWLLQKSNTFKVTGMAILYNIIIFANFHNTISYSASSIQLLYPIVFSMIKEYQNKISQARQIT